MTDVQSFEDAYRGEWDSLRAYAEDYAESTGLYVTYLRKAGKIPSTHHYSVALFTG